MAVATALAIGALAVGVIGTIAQGQAAKAKANFQAQVAEQQGNRAKQVAEVREHDFRKRISAQIATVRSIQGDVGGSRLAALEDFTAEAEVSALRIREGGEIQQSRLKQQAELLRFGGKEAEKASFFRAGGQLLSFGSKFGGGGGSLTPAQDAAQSFLPVAIPTGPGA